VATRHPFAGKAGDWRDPGGRQLLLGQSFISCQLQGNANAAHTAFAVRSR